MKSIHYIILAMVTLSMAGCKTPQGRGEPVSSNSYEDELFEDSEAVDVSYNLDPEWYWDDAWQGKNLHGRTHLMDEEADEVITWAFLFLAHEDASYSKSERWDKGIRYLGVLDGGTVSGYSPPSANVMRKLKKRYKVRSCAELRFPKRDEMDEKDPMRYRAIENARTGEVARLYYVEIHEILPGDKVIITVGVTSGPLSGGGYKFVIEKRDKEWKVLWQLRRWVS